MNIEELNLEYKSKMDALMEEYKTKVKEIAEAEEPFIKEGQRYFVIDDTFELDSYCYADDPWDKKYLSEVTLLLGYLSTIDPGGNYGNRPIHSLKEIFIPWHVQTFATIDE